MAERRSTHELRADIQAERAELADAIAALSDDARRGAARASVVVVAVVVSAVALLVVRRVRRTGAD
jgi:hypothetical protein